MEVHYSLECWSRVCKTKASTIEREFDWLSFHDNESVDDFGMLISRMTNQLAILSFEDKTEEIMRRFLQASPPKFEQITTSIKTLLDLEMITIDELIGQLKPLEEHINRNRLDQIENEPVMQLSSCLNMLGNGGLDRPKESSSISGKCEHGCGRVVAQAATMEIEVEMMQVIVVVVVAVTPGAAVVMTSQEMSDVTKERGGDKLAQPPNTACISSTVSTTAQITIFVTGTTHIS
jgi:hypothetical protein